MTNTLIHGIIDALSGSVSKEVIVFLISMIPILELRGALLVAGPILGVKVSTAIPICIIGNIIPVPFILLLITPVFNLSLIHISEPTRRTPISYAVFCLKKKNQTHKKKKTNNN